MSEAGFLIAGTELDRAYDIPPIGVPLMPFEDLHLEDEEGRRVVGPGEGELCYHNFFLRGYINLPDKTARTVRDGVLHTNDLARRDEEGLYYVVGRLDDMFKINGNRIEPAEIERRVREATGLEQVIAKGFTEGGHSFICAYFLKEEAQRLNIWDGNRLTCSLDSLREHLPDYMIPAHYVALDEFPHNANGKLVRNQLPAPRIQTGDRTYTAPAGEKETLLCALMEKALHLDQVGAEDDFYEIGGDSMGAVVLLGLCEEAGLKIPLSVLYKNRTPRDLAKAWETGQVLEGNMSERAREAMKKPLPILYEMKVHLKQMEERPDALTYNMPQLLKLKKGVDLSRLSAALDKVFRSHPALLSTFRKTDGEWYQVFDESLFEPTQIITMSDEAFEQEMTHLVAPLPALGGTPHRRALYHTDAADYMFWDLHHSIVDGTSTMLMREQVWSCYADPEYVIPEDRYAWFLEQL
jgi:acyl carrier protein